MFVDCVRKESELNPSCFLISSLRVVILKSTHNFNNPLCVSRELHLSKDWRMGLHCIVYRTNQPILEEM